MTNKKIDRGPSSPSSKVEAALAAQPEHVQTFVKLIQSVEAAKKIKNNAVNIQTAETERDVFLGTLDKTKQDQIESFVAQQMAGRQIASERNRFYGMLQSTMHGGAKTLRIIADEVPLMSEGLLFAAWGLVRGGVRGIQKANEAFQNAA